MTAKRCSACGGYVYRGSRHRTCPPKFKRQRIFACDLCGKMARGRRHRLCGGPAPKGYNRCEYCGGVTRGNRFHKPCQPDAFEYAVFADLPDLVQRRCTMCREWFPFASVIPTTETVALEAWAPKGLSHGTGRPVYDGRCRACRSQLRREAAA